jgi:hypothetical protein
MISTSLKWQQDGLAYALEHGTHPATIGLAILSSPLSLLAWYYALITQLCFC